MFSTLRTALVTRAGGLALGAALVAGIVIPTVAQAAPQVDRPTCGTDVKCIITFGDARISDRTTALDKLSSSVQNELTKQHITQAQADAITNTVKQNKDGLNTLKAKLDAETDPKAARDDVRTIYIGFRIFAIVLPRERHRLLLDVLSYTDTKLKDAEPKIEAAIAKAPADQQDALNKLYSDYKAQLAAGEKQIDAAQALLPTLTPDAFNNDRAGTTKTLTDLRTDTTAARDDLKAAAADLHQIHETLKGLKGTKSGTPTSTNS